MNCRIITQTDNDYIIVKDSKIIVVCNVESYVYDEQKFNAWRVTVSETAEPAENHYFIIDTHFHDAFGHWFFESAIYLPAFLSLKKIIPALKLHLKAPRKYKTDICKYFNIYEDDIVYEIRAKNICYFADPITAFNEKVCTDEYKQLISNLRSYFPVSPAKKSKEILFLPRQKTDNFPRQKTERQYNFDDIEKQLAESVIYTDTFQSFADQVDAVQSTKTLIVPDGSAFLVNAFLMNRSKIIVLGNITDYQAFSFPKYEYINDILISSNYIYKISYESVGGTFNSATFKYAAVEPYLAQN